MESVYDTAVAQIEKEFEEAVRRAEADRQEKLDALKILRPTLQTLFMKDSEPKAETLAISQESNDNINSAQTLSNSLSISERINREIMLIEKGQRFSQQTIFDNLAKKYADIREHEKPGNVRSQITSKLKKLFDEEKLTIEEVGRASNPNVYMKINSNKGLFTEDEE